MFFKSLRSRSKSSSKSTKPSTLTRILSTSSTHHPTIPEVVISPPLSPGAVNPDIYQTQSQHPDRDREGRVLRDGDGEGEEDGEVEDVSKDYKEFLEKARKEAERERKEAEKKAKKAREVNMSPWASRMNC